MESFLVYKSSAGSGKTYTLVKEFLKIALCDPNPTRYRNILAITFTNKAANEMKERILENLKLLSLNENDAQYNPQLIDDYSSSFKLDKETLKEKSWIVFQSILHNYSDLKVSTIDKFTHKIIRAFAKDLSLQPDFEIEMDVDTLLKSAINALVDEAGTKKTISSILLKLLDKQIDNEKSWNIEHGIFEFAKTIIREENAPFLDQLKGFSVKDLHDAAHTLAKKRQHVEEEIIKEAKHIIDLLNKHQIEKSFFSRGTFYNFFNDIREGKLEKLIEIGVTITNAIDPSIDKWLTTKAPEYAKQSLDHIKQKIRGCYGNILKLRPDYFTYQLLEENSFNIILANELYSKLNDLKETSGILLISDFNQLISEEIKDQPAPFIYEKIGERYKNIMVDEFQDTSILQWHNLLPLVDNSLSTGEQTLIVGDAKQAIYRFRGGKVEQFDSLPAIIDHNQDDLLLERETSLVNNFKEQLLEFNFRSHSQVVEFNNWFFEAITNFLPSQYKSIYNSVKQIPIEEKSTGIVHIKFIEETDKEELNNAYLASTLQQIKDVNQNGFSHKDICILVRDNKKSSLLADYLLEHQIEVITSESLVIHTNKEVNFLINFLSYIHQPNNNQAKIAITTYLAEQKTLNKLFLSNVKKEKFGNSIDLKGILNSFNKALNDIITLDVSIYDLAEHIIRTFQLNNGAPNPFLICLLDKIQEATFKQNDIGSFLEWWNEHGHKISISTPEGTNAVTIMTIHKSKGLQFPVVICPFVNWELKSRKSTLEWVNINTDLGLDLPVGLIPLKKAIKHTPFSSLLEREEESNLLDNINLLYVALTRPEKQLHIISDTNTTDKKGNLKKGLISSYLYDICQTHPNFIDNTILVGENKPIEQLNKDQQVINLLSINNILSTNWKDKVHLSELYKKNWTEGTYRESIEKGNTIHLILSKIETTTDTNKIIDRLSSEGAINYHNTEELKKEVSEIFNIPSVSEWFDGNGIVKNEHEIITNKGKSLRPDKIILYNNKTYVIDFKTGEKENKHKKQITIYGTILREMGYENVHQYLLYTKHKEVVLVP